MIMSYNNPCLVFTDCGYLCDEIDVLSSFRGTSDMNELRDAFNKALGGEIQSFRDFCADHSSCGNMEYKVLRLTGFPGYMYGFCEKNQLLGGEYTMVFLSNDISEFYRFMSPSSSYYNKAANRIVYELLYAKNKRLYKPTVITSEAFLSLNRIPYLADAILEDRRTYRRCDICAVTEHTLSHLYRNPMFGLSTVQFHINDPVLDTSSDTAFIDMPLEAYVALLLMSMAIIGMASSDHSISIVLTRMSGSSDITVATYTDKLIPEAEWGDIDSLSVLPHPVGDFARIASIVSKIADLGMTFSFHKGTHLLSLSIVIGGEIASAADFKYSDPSEDIEILVREVSDLLNTIN